MTRLNHAASISVSLTRNGKLCTGLCMQKGRGELRDKPPARVQLAADSSPRPG
ncbi:hypothetical protein ABH941_002508 [Streptacidiphilus sp. EB103A]